MFKNPFLFIIILLSLLGCKREDSIDLAPQIQFKSSSSYISSDSTIVFGKLVKVGIIAKKSFANITNIIIRVDTGKVVTAFDSSFNTDYFEYDYLLRKSQAEKETWTFTIRDRNGGESKISFVLTKSNENNFLPILHHDSITLHAQNNPIGKSTLSFTDFKQYTLEEAFNKQAEMDMFYYYGPENHTIASPGANVEVNIFSNLPDYKFDLWSTRNATRYKIYDIPEASFNAINNDSLLIIAYGVDEGKRKAKELKEGQVYSFADKSSRLGLFRVSDISGTDSGFIKLDIKIQD